MPNFEDLLINPDSQPAWEQLENLAKAPTEQLALGALSEDRVREMQASACGMTLMFATQLVTDHVLTALQQLANETKLIEQYKAMLRGEVINRILGHPSEERRVLHTASRNVFDDLTCDCDSGQADAVGEARTELDKLQRFLQDLKERRLVNACGKTFTDLVQIGIGGSDLGPRAIYKALPKFRKKRRRVHFVSNVDPDDMATVLAGLNLSRTLVNVVSKSGKTPETLTNEELARAEFARRGLDPAQHFLSVTGRGSPMDQPARYLRSFYMFDYIGGRYSWSSMVGGVALAFGLGYKNFIKMLRGAREMDLNALKPSLKENLSLLNAMIGIWNRNFLKCHTVAVLPYSQLLSRFVAHLQQLDMESNGKGVNRKGEKMQYDTGPIVWGEPGTNGQHAFYQLIHQSKTIIPCEFIAFRRSQFGRDRSDGRLTSQQKLLCNVFAQSEALATGKSDPNPARNFPGNRPNSVLVIDRLTPKTLGRLLAYYENRVAFQGFCWNINSFDQEGVELGKKVAKSYEQVILGNQQESSLNAIRATILKAAGL